MNTGLSHANSGSNNHLEAVCTWFRRAGWFSKLKSALAMRIPVGYEDSDGFHVGREPFSLTETSEFDQPESGL